MDKENLIARWMADEITDAEFRKQVSKEDFMAYKKLKLATDLYAESQRELSPGLFEKIQEKIEKPSNKYRRLYGLIAGIAAVLLLFVGVNRYLTPSVFTVETAMSEMKKVELPDHSTLILYPESKLTYSKKWDMSNREVFLEGTAYFEVKKGKAFEVKTANGSVKVLGTKFDVTSLNDWFKVDCFEGKVLVLNPYKNIELKPHTSFNLMNNKVQINTCSDDQPAWISGESRFKAVPLKYVLSQMKKQFGVDFVNRGIDENVLFTGSFVHDDLDLSLKLVFKSLRIKYSKKAGNIIVMTP